MRHIDTTQTKAENIRRAAKRISAAEHISHTAALARAAQQAGYEHWKHVLVCLQVAPCSCLPQQIADGLLAYVDAYHDRLPRGQRDSFPDFQYMTLANLLKAMVAIGMPITFETVEYHVLDQGRTLATDRRLDELTRSEAGLSGLALSAVHESAHFHKMMDGVMPLVASYFQGETVP